jgi:hypothetical protein
MWDTAALDPPSIPATNLKGLGYLQLTQLKVGVREIPPFAKRAKDPGFLHAAQDRIACAAFIKESRMHLASATNLDRKPGGMGHPSFGGATYPLQRSAYRSCPQAW